MLIKLNYSSPTEGRIFFYLLRTISLDSRTTLGSSDQGLPGWVTYSEEQGDTQHETSKAEVQGTTT